MKICISILFVFALQVQILAQKKPLVVATASMISDLTSELAGDEVEIDLIVPIGGDPHIYEPTPSDAKLVNRADLILKNGLTFEGWLNELIENSGTKAEVVTVTEHVQPIQSEKYQGATDPHAWMDVSKVKDGYIRSIRDALIKLKPESAEVFNFNYGVYKQQLEELDEYITKEIASIPKNRRVLITSHDAFQYFGIKYGIELEAILGTSTDADAQTADIMRLNKVIKERQVPAVFIESTINPKMLEQIAKDNGVVIGGSLFADSLGDEDSGASSYYDMMKRNTDQIVNALKTINVKKEEKEDSSSKSTNLILYFILGLLLIGGFFVVLRAIK